MVERPRELNESLVRSLPDKGPVVMVNLVKFHTRALDGDGTGWDAYQRYSRLVMPLIKACGGGVIWAGRAEGLAYGALQGGGFEYVVLVRYPSRAAFLDMVTSTAYAAANAHRESGVSDHVIIATTETYAR